MGVVLESSSSYQVVAAGKTNIPVQQTLLMVPSAAVEILVQEQGLQSVVVEEEEEEEEEEDPLAAGTQVGVEAVR